MGIFSEIFRELFQEMLFDNRPYTDSYGRRRRTGYPGTGYVRPEVLEREDYSARTVNFVNIYREDLEKKKAFEAELESKKKKDYIWNDKNGTPEMDDLISPDLINLDKQNRF